MFKIYYDYTHNIHTYAGKNYNYLMYAQLCK